MHILFALKQDIREQVRTTLSLNSNFEMFSYFLSEAWYFFKMIIKDNYNQVKLALEKTMLNNKGR